ncbi:MAG TPA: zf-HC2 domain-containing protein [Myxococcaceae bacterium]|nr:zf-HC2 domain-containing protein [Myxococcaceae bacterium]
MTACPTPETLAALLDGELTKNQADAVREHAAGCASCRAQEAHLQKLTSALSRLELPADEAFVQSVAAKLHRPSARRPIRFAAPAAALAAALIAAVWVTRAPPEPTPRGIANPTGPGRHLGFEAFVHPGSRAQAKRPLHEGDSLSPGDGLSFLLYNRSHQESRFLLFAVDSEGTVHWFYPAYLAPGTDPTSPVLGAAPEVVSLSEGVTPDHPAAGAFQVVAVFAPEELRVQRVEQLLAGGSLDALRRQYPDAEIQVIHARMTRSAERSTP